ncbi:MAG: hypothetical protein ACJ78Q_18855 [Chloroflexia bacterium]
MTSWTRGKKNADKGEHLMDKPDVTDKAKGVALKVAGEVEQGVDNVVDKVTGHQKTLRGTSSKPSTRKRRSTSAKSSSRAKSSTK